MPKTAFLFPGQGAQTVGMAAALCQSSPAARDLFARAAAILGFDLLDLCTNGPAERLNATDVSQPAIFVASLAALEQLKATEPDALAGVFAAAGLSLGEYTALAYAGALSFEDGVQLVQARGRAMHWLRIDEYHRGNPERPEIMGVSLGHHDASHHGQDPAKLDQLAMIEEAEMKVFAEFLQSLRGIEERDGTLLDRSMILYGSGMSNSNVHLPYDVPTVVIGGKLFGITPGRHVRHPKGTPLTNLQLTMLEKMDVRVDQREGRHRRVRPAGRSDARAGSGRG